MKYENGGEIFPEKLLKQIQKYVAGKLVYIPSGNYKRAWGETSGYKQYLCERNHNIKEKFKAGVTIPELSEAYFLSCGSIKKIVYSRKESIILKYDRTLSSAQAYAHEGKLEEWIHTYLLSDGHNKGFSDGLKLFYRYFIGPLKMPLSMFRRCCGPEEDMKYRVNGEWFEHHVSELKKVIESTEDMPPLIVNYADGIYELNDGNHRFKAYARLGIKEYYVIIWITGKADYDDFLIRYKGFIA